MVSKRLASRYSSGPSRNWVKTKCPDWKRINAERYRLFEGPPRKPELTEAQKTLAKKRQGHRAPAITAAKPRHRPRAEKAAIHLGTRDCRVGNVSPAL